MATETAQTIRNYLVPTIEKASDEELDKFCKTYNITKAQLPHIKTTDAGLVGLAVGPGDVIRAQRTSWQTGEKTLYYRLVVE